MRKFFLIIPIILSFFISIGQSPMRMLIPKKASAAGGNAYPTLVSETETVWNTTTSPKTTASITVQTGDILVAVGSVSHSGDGSLTISVAGGSLTWTQQKEVSEVNYTQLAVWTTTATSNTSFTVSFTNSFAGQMSGGDVFVFRATNGIGASNSTFNSGGPSLSLTTTAANSSVVCFSTDWNAVDGASRTWRTANVTPTAGNGMEVTYFRDAATYTVYGAVYQDVGTAAAKTIGLSAPTGQKYSIIALEIKGD